MVGRMVHGDFANDILTCSKMEQIAQKICVYQIKVITLHTVFIFEFGFMVNWTPLAVIARGVLLYIWLKKLSILRKIHFFLKKKWKKFGSIEK